MEPTNKNTRARVAVMAGVVTFCLLFITMGCVLADYNTRRVAQGTGSMRTDLYMADGVVVADFMGERHEWALPAFVRDGLAWLQDCLPPAWRLGAGLFDSGADAGAAAAERALEARGEQGTEYPEE